MFKNFNFYVAYLNNNLNFRCGLPHICAIKNKGAFFIASSSDSYCLILYRVNTYYHIS